MRERECTAMTSSCVRRRQEPDTAKQLWRRRNLKDHDSRPASPAYSYCLVRELIHSAASWIDDYAFVKMIVAIGAEHRNYMFLVAIAENCYLRDPATLEQFQTETDNSV